MGEKEIENAAHSLALVGCTPCFLGSNDVALWFCDIGYSNIEHCADSPASPLSIALANGLTILCCLRGLAEIIEVIFDKDTKRWKRESNDEHIPEEWVLEEEKLKTLVGS